MINMPSLAAASGSGQQSVVEFLIDMDETDLDRLGPDGTSPLCAATTWGYEGIVQLLLEAACDVNVLNDGTASTALHVAACQEHKNIVTLLLGGGANAMLEDDEGRTACDYASLSDQVWPFFEGRGLSRTPKPELVRKRLIRRLRSEERPATGMTVAAYTRPGSAYVRSDGSDDDGGRASGVPGPSARLPMVNELGDTEYDLVESADEPERLGGGAERLVLEGKAHQQTTTWTIRCGNWDNGRKRRRRSNDLVMAPSGWCWTCLVVPVATSPALTFLGRLRPLCKPWQNWTCPMRSQLRRGLGSEQPPTCQDSAPLRAWIKLLERVRTCIGLLLLIGLLRRIGPPRLLKRLSCAVSALGSIRSRTGSS